jgi:hypothetical protein
MILDFQVPRAPHFHDCPRCRIPFHCKGPHCEVHASPLCTNCYIVVCNLPPGDGRLGAQPRLEKHLFRREEI